MLRAEILFRPVDIASLVLLRILFGTLAFTDVLNSFVYYHLRQNAYDPDGFRFTYYGFEWVTPWPEPLLSLFFVSLILAAIGILLGYAYRASALYFAVGFTYLFLLEKAHYLNHGYLFCWLSFAMVCLPADREFSLAVWRRPGFRLETIPFWCLLVLRFLIGVVYFFGGVAKINADWLQGIPLVEWMAYKSSEPLIGPLLGLSWTPYFMAYVGLFLDLTIVCFLINRRTRPWAFALAVCFHALNMLIFNIGIFPYLSIALTAMYFSPDFPRRILDGLSRRWKWVAMSRARWWARMKQVAPGTVPGVCWQASDRFRRPIQVGLILFAAFHILVPLRHHLYPGPVAWTEEGHRYSWRMMLRSKQGRGYFRVVDEHGATEAVRPGAYLNSRQERKLYTHPDMILQFAHYLEARYQEQGREVAIFAEIETRLNEQSFQPFVDPEVDLTQEVWPLFGHADWIVPLKK